MAQLEAQLSPKSGGSRPTTSSPTKAPPSAIQQSSAAESSRDHVQQSPAKGSPGQKAVAPQPPAQQRSVSIPSACLPTVPLAGALPSSLAAGGDACGGPKLVVALHKLKPSELAAISQPRPGARKRKQSLGIHNERVNKRRRASVDSAPTSSDCSWKPRIRLSASAAELQGSKSSGKKNKADSRRSIGKQKKGKENQELDVDLLEDAEALAATLAFPDFYSVASGGDSDSEAPSTPMCLNLEDGSVSRVLGQLSIVSAEGLTEGPGSQSVPQEEAVCPENAKRALEFSAPPQPTRMHNSGPGLGNKNTPIASVKSSPASNNKSLKLPKLVLSRVSCDGTDPADSTPLMPPPPRPAPSAPMADQQSEKSSVCGELDTLVSAISSGLGDAPSDDEISFKMGAPEVHLGAEESSDLLELHQSPGTDWNAIITDAVEGLAQSAQVHMDYSLWEQPSTLQLSMTDSPASRQPDTPDSEELTSLAAHTSPCQASTPRLPSSKSKPMREVSKLAIDMVDTMITPRHSRRSDSVQKSPVRDARRSPRRVPPKTYDEDKLDQSHSAAKSSQPAVPKSTKTKTPPAETPLKQVVDENVNRELKMLSIDMVNDVTTPRQARRSDSPKKTPVGNVRRSLRDTPLKSYKEVDPDSPSTSGRSHSSPGLSRPSSSISAKPKSPKKSNDSLTKIERNRLSIDMVDSPSRSQSQPNEPVADSRRSPRAALFKAADDDELEISFRSRSSSGSSHGRSPRPHASPRRGTSRRDSDANDSDADTEDEAGGGETASKCHPQAGPSSRRKSAENNCKSPEKNTLMLNHQKLPKELKVL